MPVKVDEPAPHRFSTGKEVRLACRSGSFRGPTSGHCPSQIQTNLLVIPSRFADDFRGLCKRNPVSCPLIAESLAPGNTGLPRDVAEDVDVRTDAPGYNIYKDGKLYAKDVRDCKEWWAEDSVAFLIGCSFTFEQALVDAGLTPRHQELERNVPMYRTNIPLCPSGIFSGTMVVSMRPYKPEKVDAVRAVTRPYIHTHGEPVAWGPDAVTQLGIADLLNPEFGEAPVLREGEVPVFWGCGVTPQVVVMSSPELIGFSIGHGPGKMLCLDKEIKDILE
ncbi:hypothetical protein C367_02387 [Cryptococcus neoformans Ze90-1]|nr:hypothetical protein C367_02387 [Cryptococcus neoformans var. grubii Ze90-1]